MLAVIVLSAGLIIYAVCDWYRNKKITDWINTVQKQINHCTKAIETNRNNILELIDITSDQQKSISNLIIIYENMREENNEEQEKTD